MNHAHERCFNVDQAVGLYNTRIAGERAQLGTVGRAFVMGSVLRQMGGFAGCMDNRRTEQGGVTRAGRSLLGTRVGDLVRFFAGKFKKPGKVCHLDLRLPGPTVRGRSWLPRRRCGEGWEDGIQMPRKA